LETDLGELAEDLCQSPEVLGLMDKDGGKEDQDPFHMTECLFRVTAVLGGLEKVLGLVDEDRMRLDEGLVLLAA